MVDGNRLERVRVLLLGMRCGFTVPVVAALLADAGVDVAGVVIPGERPVGPAHILKEHHGGSAGKAVTSDRPSITLVRETPHASLDELLRRYRIPMIETPSLRRHDLAPRLAHLDRPSLDAIVVACFPWKVPRWLREVPRFGALNVHPSLLPALRGPEPEFWALRLGLRATGVTVHLMDDDLDTGAIVAQRPVPIAPEITLPELERSLAMAGGELVREALHALAAGEAEPREQVGAPSCAPVPGPYDLTVPTDLPAGWAARFVRAVAPVYAPLPVLVMATGQRLLVDGVVGVEERGTLTSPVEEDGETVAVRFSPGVVRFHRI